MHQMGISGENNDGEVNFDLQTNRKIHSLVINRNIENILSHTGGKSILKEVIYRESFPEDYLSWKQSEDRVRFSLFFFLEHPKVSTFPVRLFSGSHKKKLTKEEIELITGSSDPSEILLIPGGAILLKPLILRLFSEELKDKKLKFFELRFDLL